MRMRTVDQAYEHFKSLDPDTALTRSGLYYLVRGGEIPCVRCGKKRLVSLEAIEAYLNGEQLPQPEARPEGKPELRCIG